MSLVEAELGKLACLRKLDEIRADAPQYRIEHLQECIDKAKKAGNRIKLTR